jgi:hypothetical protein
MAKKIKVPPEEKPLVTPKESGKLVDELRHMEFEPILPVEKKLVSWSIIIGILALGFLIWLSYTFFPGGH